MKLAHKLITGFILMALTMIIVIFISNVFYRNHIKRTIAEQSLMLLQEFMDSVSAVMEFRTEQLKRYIQNYELKMTLEKSNMAYDRMENPRKEILRLDREWVNASGNSMTPLMDKLINSEFSDKMRKNIQSDSFYISNYGYPLFGEIFLANKYGANAAQTKKTSDFYQGDEEWWIKAKENGSYKGDIRYDKSSGVHSIDIAVRAEDDKGRFAGVLKAVLNIEEVCKSSKKYIQKSPYSSTNFIILNSDGKTVIDVTKGHENHIFGQKHPLFIKLKNKKGMITGIDPEQNKEKLFLYWKPGEEKKLSTQGWTGVLELDPEEVYADINRMKLIHIGIILLILICSTLTGIAISWRITKPLKKLQDYVFKLGQGHLKEKISMRSRDEIGQLATTFNRMAEKLDSSTVSNDYLKNIIDSMTGMLLIVDTKGIIVLANIALQKAAGLEADDILGTSIDSFLPNIRSKIPFGDDSVYSLFKESLTIKSEESFKKQGNETIPVIFSATPVYGINSKIEQVICIIHDISELKNYEKALELSRASFHDIVEKHADGIIVITENDYIVRYANPSAFLLLEREPDQLVGHQFGLPIIKDIFEEVEIYRPETDDYGIAEIRMFETEWEKSPAKLITLTDITRRKDLEKKLKKAKQDAEKANLAKSEFLANMSHELRSPLNSLLLLAGDLSGNRLKNLTPEQVESANIIHSSGTSLLELINGILDYSKIEAGKMEVFIKEVQLDTLAENIRRLYGCVAERKGLNMSISMDGSLPDTIQTDYSKMEQILRNLVSNAIKFTEKGNIRIEFRRPRDDDEMPPDMGMLKTIVISVHDTGIGIPPERRKDIFSAFTQADGSISRKYGGTGLGLSISVKLARLLKGHLILKSGESNGSVFSLYFPEKIETPENSEKGKTPVKEDNTDTVSQEIPEDLEYQIPEAYCRYLENKKIMIVDNRARNLFSLARILEDFSLNTYKAINGEKALTIMEEVPDMDIIIMDIEIPFLNIHKTIERMGKLSTNKACRFIALTNDAGIDTEKGPLTGVIDAYITKPPDIMELFSVMNRVTGNEAKEKINESRNK